MDNIVNVNNLYKRSADNIYILKNINMQISRSSITGLIGKSGAGKTTLLRCLNLLERPTSGQILINNLDITKLNVRALNSLRETIGVVFQSFNLLNSCTVADNIALPLRLSGVSKNIIREKVLALAKIVGLEDKLENFPNQLSGGQKQRTAIARALANDTQILICDEFTSALDPDTSLEILQLLKDVNNRLNTTIIIVSHDMNVIREICDYVFILESGSIIEHGSVEGIFYNPVHPLTKRLVNTNILNKIPTTIKENLIPSATDNCHIVIILTFLPNSSNCPIISIACRKFGLDINIILGNLDCIRASTLGSLVVSLHYNPNTYISFINYLNEHKIHSEKVGYLLCQN